MVYILMNTYCYEIITVNFSKINEKYTWSNLQDSSGFRLQMKSFVETALTCIHFTLWYLLNSLILVLFLNNIRKNK